MALDAEAILQLIAVLISVLGIGVACYNHQSIMNAGRWLYSMLPCHEHCFPNPKD
jgi:hypothetical protein